MIAGLALSLQVVISGLGAFIPPYVDLSQNAVFHTVILGLIFVAIVTISIGGSLSPAFTKRA
ncbi:MAG: hypothetical protein ABJK39_01750 [Hyphomicrobiales bacterium]